MINGLDWEAYAKHASDKGWRMKFSGNFPMISVSVFSDDGMIALGQGQCLRSAIYDSALRLRPTCDFIKEMPIAD